MGNCMSGSTVTFNEEYVSKPPDAEQVHREITATERPKAALVLSDEALLDDKTEAIEIVMQKNDIVPLTRTELERHSSEISKHAVRKLATRVNSDYEVNFVQLHLDSTNFFKELHDRGEIGAFFKNVAGKARA
mmetsp:Transcript_9231/g.17558  ORF Transcript_9231/g.17558 Transcript_9231/m.17558 type:complete len:133 (+) Transcript_9231:3077-3475(+)